jgi:hypothetical protein
MATQPYPGPRQSIPSEWIGPPGTAGYGSHWRHAGNTALLKNQISNAISPYVGKTIGDIGGGITSFGGGLLHELNAASPIWVDEKRMVDEALPFDVGPSKRLSSEFKSDTLANLFGSWKGQTGIANTEVLENLLTDMSKDDAWSNAFANLLEEEKENSDATVRQHGFLPMGHFVPNRARKFWEPRGRWMHPFKNEILDKQSWLKKMSNRKKQVILLEAQKEAAEHGHLQVPIYHQAAATGNHQQEEMYKERLSLEAEY